MLAKWVISQFPPHRIYVEPYGGAASVLLRKPRCYAEVYNDLDGEIVNVFRQARENGSRLSELLRLTPFSRDEYAESFEVAEDPLEQARRTIVRSFMGRGSNALCRGVRSGFRAGSKNSERTAAHDWKNYADALHAITERLAGVTIENIPAMDVMSANDTPKTLHYCDPPYVHATRSGCNGYSHEMTDVEHRDFAEFAHSLKGMVIVSGYDCDLYRELFGDWRQVCCDALADGARPREESLWISPSADKACPLFT